MSRSPSPTSRDNNKKSRSPIRGGRNSPTRKKASPTRRRVSPERQETDNSSTGKLSFKKKKIITPSMNENDSKKIVFKKSLGTFVNEKDVSYSMNENMMNFLKNHMGNEDVYKLGSKTHELEFRIGTFEKKRDTTEYRFESYIPRINFNRMIQHYHDKYEKLNMTENISLDIIYDDSFRVTVTGQSLVNSKNEIELFCKTNKVRNPVFMEKQQVKSSNNPDWNYRLTSSHEAPINDELLKVKLIQAVEDKTVSKFYRYKYRYSYNISDQARIDFTILKETPRDAGMTGTLVSSRTLAQKEKYQVEMEFTGSDFSIENLHKQLYKPLSELLSLYNGTKGSHEPISESHATIILQKYLDLALGMKISKELIMQKPTTTKFLAMDVEALTRQNFGLIRNDYMVTVKADGEHYMLYIHPEMGIYLINNRLNVSQVNLSDLDAKNKESENRKKIEKLGECIYDGELIEYEGKVRFMIFDCFFYGGKDIRDLPLYDKVGGKYEPNENSRIYYIKELIKIISNDNLSDELAIEEKIYYQLNKISKFFRQYSNDGRYVLNDDEFPYYIDGLIFMKVTESYPKITFSEGRFKKNGSLDDPNVSPILKWKPAEFLSIDFRVNFGVGTPKIQKINGVDYMIMTLEAAYGNKIHTFEPSCYRVKDYNLLYMPLTKGQPQLIAKPGYRVEEETIGHVIRNKDILEFVWIPDRSFGTDYWGIWFPIKYREDKTQNGFPNNYKKVSDKTWMAIHDKQITPENLMEPFEKIELNMGYYQNESRDTSIDLRNIHNAIKSVLIFLAIKQSGGGNRSKRLMDLATGRLGDLQKMTGINYVFGVEYDEANLKAGDASAYGRYRQMIDNSYSNDRSENLKIDLIQGDMRQLFSDNKASNESVFNYIMKEKLGNNRESFGIVSCQFAMHYACDSEEHLDNFMRNVSENLATDGYFIATTFDGEKILNALNNSDKTDDSGQPTLVGKDEEKKVVWSISSPVRYNRLENVGQKVMVFNKTISDEEQIEYLVNFEYIIEVAKKYNLYPGRLSYGKYNLPLDGSYGYGSFTEAYTEDFLKMVSESVYSKESPRYMELNKSFQKIPTDIKRYSKFSSFLILRKQT